MHARADPLVRKQHRCAINYGPEGGTDLNCVSARRSSSTWFWDTVKLERGLLHMGKYLPMRLQSEQTAQIFPDTVCRASQTCRSPLHMVSACSFSPSLKFFHPVLLVSSPTQSTINTLVPFFTAFRLYSTLTEHYNQSAPSNSRYNQLVFHSNTSPGTMQAKNGNTLFCAPLKIYLW